MANFTKDVLSGSVGPILAIEVRRFDCSPDGTSV